MFKRITFSRCAAAALATLALAGGASAWAAGSGHEARFGGIYLQSQAMDLEVVAKPDVLLVYASDHGKPLKVEGGKAKITLLSGAEKSVVELAPKGDRFEATGAFNVTPGTKGIVLVTLAGKPGTTARFTVK
jgi:hypothetical protein